ncbi:winged helix-turn-helix transcriptional regulator [Streptomyces albidoflavus]
MDGAGPRALGAAKGAGAARKPVGNRPSGSDAEAADQPLVADCLLERRPYRTNPVRHQYVLTERGRSLRPVIVALVDFTTGAKAVPEKAQVRGAVLARAEEDGHRVVLHALTWKKRQLSKSSSTPLTPSTAVAFHALSPRPGGGHGAGRAAAAPSPYRPSRITRSGEAPGGARHGAGRTADRALGRAVGSLPPARADRSRHRYEECLPP